MKSNNSKTRVYIALVCTAIATGVIGYRLFTLAGSQHAQYLAIAKAQYENPTALLAGRGDVFFSDERGLTSRLVATNKKENGKVVRAYPQGASAAHVLGYVGYKGLDRVGQYGVEGYYDSELKQGDTVVLTIDATVQSYAEHTLNAVLKRWSATLGTIVIEDPRSGAIIAMASSPSFDPNSYQQYALDRYLNPAVQQVFEPGSSFKPFTMSAALDTGAVTPNTTYTDPGIVTIGTYTIMNYDKKSHGVQTMTEVLEHSLNTGVMFAEQRTGDDAFLNYVVGFGFGQKTGIDLGGEVTGSLFNLYQSSAVNFATATFGQGISVTPLQLVNGIAAIANDGKLMRPYIVKEIIHAAGSKRVTQSPIIGNPIKDTTARILKTMLTDVVDKGFDRARIKGYDVAGKTGTAQIPDEQGGDLENNEFIHNFV